MTTTIPRLRAGATAETMKDATIGVTLRDFLIFQAKLVLDGLKDVAVFNLSVLALLLDLVSGRGRRPRWFYAVLRLSERFDLWLNLHGPAEDAEATGDGLFGASAAGSPTLLGHLEQIVRGGDTPRGTGRSPGSAPGGAG